MFLGLFPDFKPPTLKFSYFSLPQTFKWFFKRTSYLKNTFIFCTFYLYWRGSDFATACDSHVSVLVTVSLTIQEYRKVEHEKTSLLGSNLAKVPKALVWVFFLVFYNSFHSSYKLIVCLLIFKPLCISESSSDAETNFFEFLSGFFKRFLSETHIRKRSFIFCFSFLQCWNFDSAPERG